MAQEKGLPMTTSKTADTPIASKSEKKKLIVPPPKPSRIAAKFDIQP